MVRKMTMVRIYDNVEKDAASPMGIKNPAGTYIHSYFNKWGTKVRERITFGTIHFVFAIFCRLLIFLETPRF